MKMYREDLYKSSFTTAILIKESSHNDQALQGYYLNELKKAGVDTSDIICLSLEYKQSKAKAADIKVYLEQLAPALKGMGIKRLFVCDSLYFKAITKHKKADPFLGIVTNTKVPCLDELDMKVMAGINHSAVMHNPNNAPKLKRGLDCLGKWINGTLSVASPVKSASYPKSLADIKMFLDSMLKEPEIVIDTETFGLYFRSDRMGMVGIAPNTSSGGAFLVDAKVDENWCSEPYDNKPVKRLLKNFLNAYKGKVFYHNINFDIKMLIWWLYLEPVACPETQYKIQLDRVAHLLRNAHCTQAITYLATNNAVKNALGLKEQAQEFAGNWAVENIDDITKIPIKDLLTYCVIDCCSTFFVRNKHYPTMVADDQLSIYETIFRPAMVTLINAELNGMPMSSSEMEKQKTIMETIEQKHSKDLAKNPLVAAYTHEMRLQKIIDDNVELKTKQRTMEECMHVQFNSGSPKQLAELLFDYLGFEPLGLTPTKQPETGGETIESLLNQVVMKFDLKPEDYHEL